MSEKNRGTLHIGREPFKKCILGKQWSYHHVGPVAAQRHLHHERSLLYPHFDNVQLLYNLGSLSERLSLHTITYSICTGTTPLGRGTRILT